MNATQRSLNILLFLILVTPTVSPYIYVTIMTVTLLLMGVFGSLSFNVKSRMFAFASIVYLYVILSCSLRIGLWQHESLRDLIEVGRWLPAIILVSLAPSFRKVYPENFYSVLGFVTLINVAVVFSQVQGGNALSSFIENIYANDAHALYSSNRATGLANGPGDLAVLYIAMFSYFYTHMLTGHRKYSSLILTIASAYVAWTTQSQTGLIGLVVAFVIISFIFLLLGRAQQRFNTFVFVLGGVVIALTTTFVARFIINTSYLGTLFVQGLERNAYVMREQKWLTLLSLAEERLVAGTVLGWGKEHFGILSTAMDNEYLYVLLVYGPLVFIIFYGSLITYSFKLLRELFSELEITYIALLGMIGASLVVSWPSGFFIYPKVGMLFLFLAMCVQLKNKERKRSRIAKW